MPYLTLDNTVLPLPLCAHLRNTFFLHLSYQLPSSIKQSCPCTFAVDVFLGPPTLIFVQLFTIGLGFVEKNVDEFHFIDLNFVQVTESRAAR